MTGTPLATSRQVWISMRDRVTWCLRLEQPLTWLPTSRGSRIGAFRKDLTVSPAKLHGATSASFYMTLYGQGGMWRSRKQYTVFVSNWVVHVIPAMLALHRYSAPMGHPIDGTCQDVELLCFLAGFAEPFAAGEPELQICS